MAAYETARQSIQKSAVYTEIWYEFDWLTAVSVFCNEVQ